MNMSLQLVVLICIYCIHISYALPGASDNLLAGAPIAINLQRFKRATEIACDVKKPSKQCASDCKTLLFCDAGIILGKVSCPTAKPDCDIVSHNCVEKRPANQCPATQQTDASCPAEEGYFPDPTNCRIYNYCENSIVMQKYSCPLYYAFDIEAKSCRRGAPCGNINCYGKVAALHSTYSFLYAFCNNNAVIQGSYAMCQQTSQEFDLNSFECVSKCRTEGNIPHETECNLFYRCLATGPWGTLEKTKMPCPPRQNFNKDSLLCDKNYECTVDTTVDPNPTTTPATAS